VTVEDDDLERVPRCLQLCSTSLRCVGRQPALVTRSGTVVIRESARDGHPRDLRRSLAANVDISGLDSIPLFAALPRKERAVVAEHADEIRLEQGFHILDEGHLAYELFVFKSGTADVIHDGAVIAQIGPGDVVGEIGVLKTHVRTATVIATSPVEAIVMYGPELTALKRLVPHVWAELERLVEERS
jgi:hypothetical protein